MSTLAERQLAAWQDIARDWPLYRESLDARVELCKRCDRGVILIRDERFRPYDYSAQQRLALIVLHLRNHHADLDPDREAT